MPKYWYAIFFPVLLWSGIAPKDYFTWFLETLPALLALALLWWTRTSFPLSALAYALILVHCIILMVGGHYTYAEVPLFDWIRELLALERNNYDKLGHFAQGFVPAIVAREIIIRKNIVNGTRWTGFFVITTCLAVSAFYELVEWWVALSSGESAEAFLGTQGYVWDTQSDMFHALVGATVALLTLSGVHNRQLARLRPME